MKITLCDASLTNGIQNDKRLCNAAKGWLKNEVLQQCLKKARCQQGIVRPLEEILPRKEDELLRISGRMGDEAQFNTIQLGGGFFAIVDCVNRLVKVNGWTELGMFKFEFCFALKP